MAELTGQIQCCACKCLTITEDIECWLDVFADLALINIPIMATSSLRQDIMNVELGRNDNTGLNDNTVFNELINTKGLYKIYFREKEQVFHNKQR